MDRPCIPGGQASSPISVQSREGQSTAFLRAPALTRIWTHNVAARALLAEESGEHRPESAHVGQRERERERGGGRDTGRRGEGRDGMEEWGS